MNNRLNTSIDDEISEDFAIQLTQEELDSLLLAGFSIEESDVSEDEADDLSEVEELPPVDAHVVDVPMAPDAMFAFDLLGLFQAAPIVPQAQEDEVEELMSIVKVPRCG